MMGYGYGGGYWMMWVFGGLIMVGVLVLIGLVAWAIVTATTRTNPGQATPNSPTADAGGRDRTRQVLDERYALGEMTTDEYTERLHTMGL